MRARLLLYTPTRDRILLGAVCMGVRRRRAHTDHVLSVLGVDADASEDVLGVDATQTVHINKQAGRREATAEQLTALLAGEPTAVSSAPALVTALCAIFEREYACLDYGELPAACAQ